MLRRRPKLGIFGSFSPLFRQLEFVTKASNVDLESSRSALGSSPHNHSAQGRLRQLGALQTAAERGDPSPEKPGCMAT